MRSGAEESAAPPRFGLAPSLLKREMLRALLAFGVYLLLYPIWIVSGAGRAYGWLVPRAAAALDAVTRHFPRLSAIQDVPARYFDFLIILVLAYAVASHGMGFRARARRVVLLVAVIVVVHIVALTVQARVLQARDLWASERVMLLLPRELQAAVWLKYMLFEFGLQLAPFVLVGIWVYWNVMDRAPRPGGRPPWNPARIFAGPAAALLALSGFFAWSAVRERDPRHVRAHVWFAERFLRERSWAPAEREYRAAIAGGCRDGYVYYNLAEIRRRNGDLSGSLELLRHGLAVVQDTEWRERLRQAIEANTSGAARPGRPPL